MVDGTLKRLLDAETEAERIVARADEQRRTIVEQAKIDVRTAEQQHATHLTEIRSSLLEQAELCAQQTISSLQRRYAEQANALHTAVQQHEQQALDEAYALLIGYPNSVEQR